MKAIAGQIGELIPEEELRIEFTKQLFERDYTEIAKKIQAFREENNRVRPERKPRKRRVRKKRTK